MHIGKVNGLAKEVPREVQRGSLRTNQTTVKETIVLEQKKELYIPGIEKRVIYKLYISYIYIYSLKDNLCKQVEKDYEAGGTDGKMEQTDGKTLFLKKIIYL